MKFTTFYFSGTGNTEWVVKQFNQIIIKRGHEGEAVSIECIDDKNFPFYADLVRNSDFLGFANPIYGGNIPPVMRSFIDKLIITLSSEKQSSKPVYFINTFAYINGFGPLCTKRMLKNTGFTLVSYVNIQICNNISSPKLRVKGLRHDILDKRKEKAKLELEKMTDMLLAGKSYITGIGPYLIPNIFIRKKSKKAIEDNYKVLSVKIATCNKCMLCVNKCPTRSIKYKDNCFEFLPTCTACMRCYNNCPTYSILFDGIYADPDIYERYHGPNIVKS